MSGAVTRIASCLSLAFGAILLCNCSKPFPASSATYADCGIYADNATKFKYIARRLSYEDDKLMDQHAVEGVVTRNADGLVIIEEADALTVVGPVATEISTRDGVERHRRSFGRRDFNEPADHVSSERGLDIDPASASLASDADFDFVETNQNTKLRSRGELHAHRLGTGVITLAACPFKIVRWELTSGRDAVVGFREEVSYAPDLRIVLSRTILAARSRQILVVTDVTTDTSAKDIGFPFDTPLPFGSGLPFAPSGAVAFALNLNATADDCMKLRNGGTPFVLASYVKLKPRWGRNWEDLPFQRVNRLPDGSVELIELFGEERGRLLYRHGFLVRTERQEEQVDVSTTYDGLSDQTLASRKDVDLPFRTEIVSRKRNTTRSAAGIMHLTFSGTQHIRLGLCYYEVLAYNEAYSTQPDVKLGFLYSPDLGIRVSSEYEDIAGHGRVFKAFSISTNTTPVPGLIDAPVPK